MRSCRVLNFTKAKYNLTESLRSTYTDYVFPNLDINKICVSSTIIIAKNRFQNSEFFVLLFTQAFRFD